MNKFVSKLLVIVAFALIAPIAQVNAQTADLSVSCNAEVDSAYVGDTVTWKSNVSGGEAPYTYSWSASSLGSQNNPISGSSENASKTYTAAGSYGAKLTVTDAAFTVAIAECSPRLTVIAPLEFDSCTPNEVVSNTGYETTWTVKLKGGVAPYGFTLVGTDGLSGTTEKTKITYTTAGVKTGTVSNLSSSDGQVVTGSFNCASATVEAAAAELTASCSADNSKVETDEEVVWSVSVSGGDAPYTYNWDGTDNLSGSATTIKKTYTTEGTKTATVDVTSSDGQVVIDATCSTTVKDEESSSSRSGSGRSSSSRNNNNSNDNNVVTTVRENQTPINPVTATPNRISNNSPRITVSGEVSGTSTATSTVTTSAEIIVSTTTGTSSLDRANQLANVSSFAFITDHKIFSTILALFVVFVAWFLFFFRKENKE